MKTSSYRNDLSRFPVCTRPSAASRPTRRAKRTQISRTAARRAHADRHAALLLDNYAHFFSALPTAEDATEWAAALRRALHHLCPDVDRITLAVDLACRPDVGDRPVGQVVIADANANGRANCPGHPAGSSPGETVARRAARAPGFSGQFRPPVAFDYRSASGDYVGSIVLWNERRRPPVSHLSIATMTAAEPLLAFLLSEGRLRAQCAARSLTELGQLGRVASSTPNHLRCQ